MTDRLVVFDMDGTLLDSAKQLQPGTLPALERVRAAGARIMLASGRPLAGLRLLAERLGLGDDLILSGLNGSTIEFSRGVTAEKEVPWECALPMMRLGEETGAVVLVPREDELWTLHPESHEAAHEAGGNGLTVRGLDRFEDLPVHPTKILFVAPTERLEALRGRLEPLYGDRAEITFSSPTYMEATAHGVDKSLAVRRVCRDLEIPLEDVLAFGDNGNDVTMLAMVGWGVAMGNAIPEARAAADEVTASHDDDGIARALERHFPSAP